MKKQNPEVRVIIARDVKLSQSQVWNPDIFCREYTGESLQNRMEENAGCYKVDVTHIAIAGTYGEIERIEKRYKLDELKAASMSFFEIKGREGEFRANFYGVPRS